VGPYYVHWTDSSVVSFHDVGEKEKSFAMVYPNKDPFIDPSKSKEKLMNFCQLITEFNNSKYDPFRNNCHDFVSKSLQILSPVDWLKKGPIVNFLEFARSNEANNKTWIVPKFDGTGFVTFDTHEQFCNYCLSDGTIKQIFKKRDSYLGQLTQGEIEYLEVLKAIERGHILQNANESKSNTRLFPLESSKILGSFTALVEVTMFQTKY